jgi:hypothetical protein
MNTFFDNRREALLNNLTDMENCYRTFPDVPQMPTLAATTHRLWQFATDILYFFNAGFTSGKLESKEYPPNNVYAILLNQIAIDIEVIRRAADQRITSGSIEMKKRLKEADKLAWLALQKAVGSDKPLEPGTTVVTYFQKSPAVRVIPYANVALIGIPFTCVDEPRDLLATPHEVGHYIYWHARNSVPAPVGRAYFFFCAVVDQAVDRLRDLITPGRPEFANWCLRWLEELCADVYGCWTAGPVSALTLQDNQKNRAVSEFAETDGEHPAPVLRPYTDWKVLNNRAVAPAILSLMTSHWQAVLSDYGDPSSLGRPDGPNITVDEAVEAKPSLGVEQPVDQLVKLLLERLTNFGVPSGDWRSGSSVPATVGELYEQFESFVQNDLSELPVVSQPEAELSGPLNFTEWAKQRFDNSPDLIALIDNPANPEAKTIPEANWLPIVRARGWTTAGPETFWP